MWDLKTKISFLVNAAFYGAVIVLAVLALRYVFPVLVPFFVACLVASALRWLIGRFSLFSKRKKISAIFLCTAFYVLAFFLLGLLGIRLLGSIGRFVESAPTFYSEQIMPWLNRLSDYMETTTAAINPLLSQRIDAAFQEFAQNISSYISDLSLRLLRLVSQVVVSVPNLVIRTVVTIIATFFMTIDYDNILGFFGRFIPAEKQTAIRNGVDYIKNILWIYLRSYAFLFLLTFTELLIGLSILRIPYAMALSIGIAVFDILPVLGTGGILIPWGLVLIALKNVPLGVGILLLYLAILIVRNTLEPRIVGKQIGLHPLATLVSMFLGLHFLGILGLILFPVTLTVVYNLKLKMK